MVRERVLRLVLVVAMMPLASGVASAANKEHLQMLAEIRMLQEQTAMLRAQLTALNETLRALGTRLDEQAGASRKAFADQKLSVDNLTDNLRVIREKVDDNNVRVGSLSQELEAIRAAIAQTTPPPAPAGADATNPAAAPPTSGAQPTTGGSPAAAASQPPALPAVPAQSPQRLYDTAWADYVAAQYNLAITEFQNFIRTFGRSEQAGDAQYFIGECYYQQGMFKEAVAAYDRGIADYPNSQRIPDMYFKRGMAFNALGLLDRARESWEYVVKNFPNSDAGRLARQRLDQIIRKDPPSDPLTVN
jgi:tol-pal system protein YbgF